MFFRPAFAVFFSGVRGPNTHPTRLGCYQRASGQFFSVPRENLSTHFGLADGAKSNQPDDSSVGNISEHGQFSEVLIECDQDSSFAG
jgi:hypothetical protein